MDPGGLVFVFTEAPTKNLELAKELIEAKIRFRIKINIMLHSHQS